MLAGYALPVLCEAGGRTDLVVAGSGKLKGYDATVVDKLRGVKAVVAGEDWHPGVVGIVAGRVTRKYHRPCVVLGNEGEFAKGSGRSIDGVNLVEVLGDEAWEALLRYDHLQPNTTVTADRTRTIAGVAYWFPHQGLVTVWSAPNYFYRCGNVAAVFEVNEQLEREFLIFRAVKTKESQQSYYQAVPYFL